MMQFTAPARISLFFCLLLFTTPLLSLAQQTDDPKTKTLQPTRITHNFDITGTLSHEVWDQAEPVYITHEVQPNDEARAPVQTKVRVLYSKKFLYVGFESTDPVPERIRASIADRDASFQDDFVGLFLDPFKNNQQAYEFFVNPFGVQMDGMRSGSNEDMNFDALWYSQGAITDSGYTVAMKIPFKSLNFPKQDVQDWSVQFLRNYPRNSRYQMAWTDVSIDNPCLMCQNGRLIGLEGLESSNTVELLPYAMSFQNSTIDDSQNPSSGLDHGPLNGRIGGSISYAPTSTTSLDAVINPDFSQVETDAAQIGVNETFALFFPEKRPFFLRDADLFRTQQDLFYSRMINRPLAAGKVTQKSSRYSVAFLTAYDRETPFIIPGKYGSSLVRSEVNAYSNILRARYNLADDESYIGGLITTRNQQDASNYVGSIDWQFLLADHYYFNGQLGYSNTTELNDTALFDDARTFGNSAYDAAFNGEQYSGTLISGELERQAKYYNFSFGYTSFSPTFQSQGGFINRTDHRQFEAEQSFSYYPDKQWLSQGSISASGTWRYDFTGQFQERYIFLSSNNNFAGQTQVSVSYLPVNDERFRGEYFTDMRRLMVDVNTRPLDAIAFGGHIDFGRYVNRADDPTLGKGYNFSADALVKPTSRLQFEFSYSYSTLSSVDGSREYYSGDIMRLTSRYNFSRKLFARLITQYDSFGEQIQLYPLVYYKANPFTKFYIGMTDYLNQYDENGGFDGYRQTNRQFFVKFQYLIRS